MHENAALTHINARSALHAIAPPTDRKAWLGLLFAAKELGITVDEAADWSERGDFSADSVRRQWRSLKRDRSGGSALWKSARAAGWNPGEGWTPPVVTEEEIAKRKERSAKDDARRLVQSRARSRAIWNDCTPLTSDRDHLYLRQKSCRPDGLRILRKNLTNGKHVLPPGTLVVPGYDAAGELQCLQFIRAPNWSPPDGWPGDPPPRKSTLAGGFPSGMRFVVGPMTDQVFVVEGLATANAVHRALPEYAAIVAFGSTEIETVAAGLVASGRKVVIAMDAAGPDRPDPSYSVAVKLGCGWARMPAGSRSNLDWQDIFQEKTDGLPADEANQEVRQLIVSGISWAKRRHTAAPRPRVPIFVPPTPQFDFSTIATWEPKSGGEAKWFSAANTAAKNGGDVLAIVHFAANRLGSQTPGRFAAPRDAIKHLTAQLSSEALAKLPPAYLPAIEAQFGRRLFARQAQVLKYHGISKEVAAQHIYKKTDKLPDFLVHVDGVSWVEHPNGVHLCRAPLGVGKTRNVLTPFCERESANGRFVVLTHRTSLVSQLAKALQVHHYKETDGEEFLPNLAICLPSIIKPRFADIINNVEYLAIDEIQQVIDDLQASIHKKRSPLMFRVLLEMIRRAKVVIGTDAHISDRTIEFIQLARPGEKFYIYDVVPPKTQRLQADVMWGKDAESFVMTEMIARVERGESIHVACESVRHAQAVAKILREHTTRPILEITGVDMSEERQRFFDDPNGESLRYAALVHSPAISAGVSITVDHFSHAYIFYSGHSIMPAAAVQMTRRCRKISHATVCLSANTTDGFVDGDALIKGMQKSVGEDLAPTSFDRFIAELKAGETSIRQDGAAALLWLMAEEGWELKYPRHGIALDLEEQMAAIRKTLKESERAAILAAPDMPREQVEKLKREQVQTPAMAAIIERHEIAKSLGLDSLATQVFGPADEAPATNLEIWETYGPSVLRKNAAAFRGSRGSDAAIDHLVLADKQAGRHAALALLQGRVDLSHGASLDSAALEAIAGWVAEQPEMLAYLGLAPAKFANPKAAPPKPSIKFATSILARFGVKVACARPHGSARVYTIDRSDDERLAAFARALQIRDQVNVSYIGTPEVEQAEKPTLRPLSWLRVALLRQAEQAGRQDLATFARQLDAAIGEVVATAKAQGDSIATISARAMAGLRGSRGWVGDH
jgi:hypothetical protein